MVHTYDAWKEMLLDEKWFENSAAFDELFAKLLVQNDAMVCIEDGRKWGAKFFGQVSAECGKKGQRCVQRSQGTLARSVRLQGG